MRRGTPLLFLRREALLWLRTHLLRPHTNSITAAYVHANRTPAAVLQNELARAARHTQQCTRAYCTDGRPDSGVDDVIL